MMADIIRRRHKWVMRYTRELPRELQAYYRERSQRRLEAVA